MKLEWRTEKRKVSDLVPYTKNPRVLSEKQANDLRVSLSKFNLVEIPAINTDNTILAGHQRLKIMAMLGRSEEEIDVRIPNRTLTEKEVEEYNIRSNRNTGDWDFSTLMEDFDLNELVDWGFDAKQLSTEFDKLREAEEDEFEPEPPEEPDSKRGQVYLLGEHRVMCGDATSPGDIATLMNGEKAAMLFTDPPYNVDYTGKTKDALKIQNDHFATRQAYQEFLLKAFANAVRSMVAGGGAYICHADSEGLPTRQAFEDSKFKLKQCLIWRKDSMVMGRQDYHWAHEPILYGWTPGDKHSYYGGRKQTTVWDVERPKRSKEHPTMKPIKLVAKAIRNSSKQGEIVLDLFAGAGSTLIAAQQLGRKAFVMELDPRYVDVIRKRYAEYTSKSEAE